MPKLHDVPITVEMQAALLEWFEAMPDSVVVAVGVNLPGGFRKAAIIRERIKGMIQGQGPLPSWLIFEIRCSFPTCSGVHPLSIQALRERFVTLAAAASPAQILIALLVDERPDVRQLGIERLRESSRVVSEEEREEARDLWVQIVNETFVECFGREIKPLVDEAEETPLHPDAVKSLQLTAEQQEEELRETKAKLANERELRAQDRRAFTASLKEAQDRHAREVAGLKQQLKELGLAKVALEHSLQAREKEQRDVISSGIQNELRSLQHHWLTEVTAVHAQRSESESSDILSRVHSALEAQALMDRHSGNRLVLGQKLQGLKSALQMLRDARQNALKPIPELGRLTGEVEHDIARIELKLGSAKSRDPFVERLLQNVNTAPDFIGLEVNGALVESLTSEHLLTADQAGEIYSALQRCHAILVAQCKTPLDGQGNHWLSFPNLLRQNIDCLLLVDGHNVLFALDHLLPWFDEGKPGARARSRLIQLVRFLVVDHPRIQARVVFDSPEPAVENLTANLTIEFSGGVGDHRADEAILRRLTPKSLQELKHRIFVVTNDRDLQRRIRTHHAHYIPAGYFDLLLRDVRSREHR